MATPAIYQANQGPSGLNHATVNGTIQTDGATGILAVANILNWNIEVTNVLGARLI